MSDQSLEVICPPEKEGPESVESERGGTSEEDEVVAGRVVLT